MSKNMIQLSDMVKDTLREATVDGNYINIGPVGSLSREDYEEVNKAITALGGKWNRGKKCHVFPGPVADVLHDVLMAGEILDTKKEFQFFETPNELANRMAEALDIQDGMKIFEPSAGRGRLLDAVIAVSQKVSVMAFEIQPDLVKVLQGKYHGVSVIQRDFLTVKPYPVFDGVIMNPPFTGGQDIEHIRRAMEWLKPGGKLVAICSPGYTFRSDAKHADFRGWTQDMGHLFSEEELPEGTFSESGTNVRTMLLEIRNRG